MILDFLFKKPSCEVCSMQNAKDVLVYPQVGSKALRKNLCREHFLKAFSEAFLAFPHKMLVLYPQVTLWNSSYSFYPVSEMGDYAYEPDDIEMVKNVIRSIPVGKDCAYFDVEASRKATTSSLWQSAALLDPSLVTFMSKEETLRQILQGFSLREGDFSDGFTTPYKEDGAYLSALL